MIFQTSMRTCSMLIFRGIVSCDTFSYFFITASTFHDLQYRTGGGWVEPTHLKNMGTAKLDYFFQGLGWKQKILELPPPRYVYIYIPSFISFSKKTTSSNITKHSTNQNNWNFLNKKSKRLIKASPNFCEKNIPQTRFFFFDKKIHPLIEQASKAWIWVLQTSKGKHGTSTTPTKRFRNDTGGIGRRFWWIWSIVQRCCFLWGEIEEAVFLLWNGGWKMVSERKETIRYY